MKKLQNKNGVTIGLLVIIIIFSQAFIYLFSSDSGITAFAITEFVNKSIEKKKFANISEQFFIDEKRQEEILLLYGDVSEETAFNALSRGKEIKSELELLNMKTAYIADQLVLAESAFNGQNVTKLVEQIFAIENLTLRQEFVNSLNTTFIPEEIDLLLNRSPKIRFDYPKVLLHVSLIDKRRNLTFDIVDQMALLDQKLSVLNITEFNFTEVFQAQRVIKDKFDKEQLEEIPPLVSNALLRIEQLQLEQTRLRAYIRAAQQNIVGFIKRHPFAITITFILVVVFSMIFYNELVISVLKRKIEDFKSEQIILKDLMKLAQLDYFTKGSITKSIYDIKMKKYDEKQIEIREKLPVLEQNLVDRIKKRNYYIPYINKLINYIRDFVKKNIILSK